MAKKKKKNRKNQKKQVNPGVKALDIILSVALVAGVCYGGYHVAANGVKIDQTTTYYTPDEIQESTEAPTEEAGIIYGNEEYPNSAIHTGTLILVNNNNACETGEAGLVSLGLKKLDADNHSFAGVTDNELSVTEDMADALLAMFDGFYNETFDDNILVVSRYRSQEHQQELYDEDLEKTGLDYSERVSLPGYSEHQTGMGVDLELVDGEYDGTGTYAWIDEHCAEYGIILRYPEDKQEITGITFEPWHYRYVGIPHAAFIMEHGMCLEEYIDYVKEFPYDGEHLEITGTDGKLYEVYYFPEDTEYETTMVPVPGGGLPYTVSGNNVDGFIVTVELGDAPAGGAVDTTDAEQPAEEESSEDTADGEAESPEESVE